MAMRITVNPTQFKQWVTDLSHDELIGALQIMFPGSVHGRDYLVGHPVEQGSAARSGPAQIMAWNLDAAMPDVDADVAPVWAQHGPTIQNTLAESTARAARVPLLAQADILVNKAQDSNDADALAKARAYRQALRDVPEQQGFPTNITWPTKP